MTKLHSVRRRPSCRRTSAPKDNAPRVCRPLGSVALGSVALGTVAGGTVLNSGAGDISLNLPANDLNSLSIVAARAASV